MLGMFQIENSNAARPPSKILFLFLNVKSGIFCVILETIPASKTRVVFAGIFFIKLSTAGIIVSANRKSVIDPIAPRKANSRIGRIFVTESAKKPAAVVIAVKNAGRQILMIVERAASLPSKPACI